MRKFLERIFFFFFEEVEVIEDILMTDEEWEELLNQPTL